MSLKRYRHTVSMAHLAKEIALANNLDGRKAYVAGMLHDIAKEMPHDEAVVNARKNTLRSSSYENNGSDSSCCRK